MELADERQNRPRRANAGNRLVELLEHGFDPDEEERLRELEAASDSSFTASDPSSDSGGGDVFDSDFSDEEEEGVLDGEVVETEMAARREERRARGQTRQRELQRMRNFSRKGGKAKPISAKRSDVGGHHSAKGSATTATRGRKRVRLPHSAGTADDQSDRSGGASAGEEEEEGETDLRQIVRRRPPSTIPLQQRMAEAAARAVQRAEELEDGDSGDAAKLTHSLLSARQRQGTSRSAAAVARRRRMAGQRAGVGWSGLDGSAGGDSSNAMDSAPSGAKVSVGDLNRRMWLYAGSREEPRRPQQVQYHSSKRMLEELGTAVVYSFSVDLPPAFSRK